jgi:hypothetical protein
MFSAVLELLHVTEGLTLRHLKLIKRWILLTYATTSSIPTTNTDHKPRSKKRS